MVEISIEMIVECVRKVANKDIDADTDIFAAGVDSLTVLRCRAMLKDQAGIKLPGHVFFGGRTPAGIVELIGSEHAGR